MTNGTDAVRQRYAMGGILERVIAFLLERGIDPERPNYQGFFSLRPTPRARNRSYTRAYRAGWYQFEHARGRAWIATPCLSSRWPAAHHNVRHRWARFLLNG